MLTGILTGEIFSNLINGGAQELYLNRKIVNDLNVFPIPDGDTGDNMYMTINAGAKAALNADHTTLESTATDISKAMLLGARGNSGVILSRIFSGIAKGFTQANTADLNQFMQACKSGVKEAYNAVSQPVEGTILTVFRQTVENCADCKFTSFEDLFQNLIKTATTSLENTPNLLPVLKQAGVVDSGGAGLVYIFQGMLNALNGKKYDLPQNEPSPKTANVDIDSFTKDSVLEFGYCTEFILRLQNCKTSIEVFNDRDFLNKLNSLGESVVFFRDEDLVKVHIHTKKPGEILNFAQTFGEFLTLKVENMMLQHHQTTIQNNYTPTRQGPKKYAAVAVAFGAGIKNSFVELGVDQIIDGGQTMNPSSRDFIDAFEKINAENIFVFPNNSNIILAANQAKELYDKAKIHIIPTKTIGQGYAAISSLDFNLPDTSQIIEECNTIISQTVTAMVSQAIRDTNINNIQISEGQYLGFNDDTVLVSASSPENACRELCSKINCSNYGLMLLIYGQDISDLNAQELYKTLQTQYNLLKSF